MGDQGISSWSREKLEAAYLAEHKNYTDIFARWADLRKGALEPGTEIVTLEDYGNSRAQLVGGFMDWMQHAIQFRTTGLEFQTHMSDPKQEKEMLNLGPYWKNRLPMRLEWGRIRFVVSSEVARTMRERMQAEIDRRNSHA